VVGPGIGPCCFEVSAAVGGLFEEQHRLQRGPRLFIDLVSVLLSQWRRCGGRASGFWNLNRCTVCSEPALHSYRREHAPGRNYAYIFS
jgi:copper oxidase (laccase) domain-containing protein